MVERRPSASTIPIGSENAIAVTPSTMVSMMPPKSFVSTATRPKRPPKSNQPTIKGKATQYHNP